MSQMVLSAGYTGDIHLNVLNFSAPIFNSFNSASTKHYAVHFPIKTNQPTLKMQVQFSNEQDFETFQNFVRKHHVVAVGEGQDIPECTFNWPERDINNFTGFIKKFRAGGKKGNVAPKAEIEVELINSMVSEKTNMNSFGSAFEAVYGPQIFELQDILKDPSDILPSIIDSILRLPNRLGSQGPNGPTWGSGRFYSQGWGG